MIKDCSYEQRKVVYLKNIKQYTTDTQGNGTTTNLLNAIHYYNTVDDEKIINFLIPNLKEQAQIATIILSAMILE